MNKSFIIHGSIADDQFRLFAADTTELVQTARDLHDLYPLSTIMMGRAISAVVLMSAELKEPGSEVSIRIDGEGELKGALVIANKEGEVKGYAFEPHLWFEEKDENFKVGKHIGKGLFTVIKQVPSKKPYQGSIQLVNSEIGEDMAAYYEQSQQIPTAINLGVLLSADSTIKAAGGILIQQLPLADPKLADQISANLAATPNISDLMDMGLSIEDILERFVLKGLEYKFYEKRELKYHCDCSKERFARALKMLGKEELEEMKDGIEPVCHYCNKSYSFTRADIEKIIAEL